MRIAVLVLACACVGCASDRDLSDQDQPPPLQQPASSAPPSPKAAPTVVPTAAPTVARNDPNEANRRLMALSEKDRRMSSSIPAAKAARKLSARFIRGLTSQVATPFGALGVAAVRPTRFS